MSYTYRFIEELSITDAAFEVTSDTLSGLFEGAAVATFEVMADTSTVRAVEKRKIKLKERGPDILLYSWLEELIFLKDAEGIIFSKFDIMIKEGYELEAEASGELIGDYTGELKTDVKAVTMHLFEVKQIEERWWARVVLDI